MLVKCGVLLGLGLAALVVWQFLPPKPGVTPANFHRLRVGMSEQEVKAILGEAGTRSGSTFTYWFTADSTVTIEFTEGNAEWGQLMMGDGQGESLPGLSPPFWDRLRVLLPR